jgi:serine protease Do
MFHQTSGSRLLSAIALVSLFSACAQQSSSAAAPGGNGPPVLSPPSGTTSTPQVATSPSASLVRGLPDFTGLVTAVGPAVVNVQVVERMSNVRGNVVSPFGNGNDDEDDPFGEFFRRFGIPRGQGQIPNQRGEGSISRGEGSGFIVSPDGYLLTNAHVVDNASSVTVKLTDHREYKAKVVGVDDTSDVAVLKIDGKNLPVVKIGDPSKLRAGEWVVAIGSPFGMENSVTAGIVSATGRAVTNGTQRNYVNFIQTDVAVNPGNSGGPLFNMNGEVVGINSQIYSTTGSYAGLSFAIPIDIATNVRDQLVKNGRVTRGIIGVTIQPVTSDLAESYGLDRPHGAAVGSVTEGGPAAKAGVKPDDVILAVNGHAVENSVELPGMIAAIKPGTTAQLEIWRDKASRKITVTVDELKDDKRVATRTRGSGEPGRASTTVEKLGLSVRELSAREKQQLKTDGNVVVEEARGAAAEAGLQSGDIILAAGGTRIDSVDDLRNAVRGAGVARLRVQNQNGIGLITIRPE